MRQAFIVCGAECSGNRLMAGLLVSAGCWGRGSDKQPSPAEIGDAEKVVVIAHLLIDLVAWCEHFKITGHRVHFLIMVRDPWVQVRSRSKASGLPHKECRWRYLMDYGAAFQLIGEQDHPFTLVPYEALIQPGSPARILSLFDLAQEKPLIVMGKITDIRDENQKWFKEQP